MPHKNNTCSQPKLKSRQCFLGKKKNVHVSHESAFSVLFWSHSGNINLRCSTGFDPKKVTGRSEYEKRHNSSGASYLSLRAASRRGPVMGLPFRSSRLHWRHQGSCAQGCAWKILTAGSLSLHLETPLHPPPPPDKSFSSLGPAKKHAGSSAKWKWRASCSKRTKTFKRATAEP